MVKASKKSRDHAINVTRSELVKLRAENERLRKKVAQAEAAQEILGKAFGLLGAVNQSPNEDPIQIPPALMTLDQYKRWLSGHHVAGDRGTGRIATVTELAGCGSAGQGWMCTGGVARATYYRIVNGYRHYRACQVVCGSCSVQSGVREVLVDSFGVDASRACSNARFQLVVTAPSIRHPAARRLLAGSPFSLARSRARLSSMLQMAIHSSFTAAASLGSARGFGDLAQLVVQRLDAVGGVDDPAQLGWERQERGEPLPGVAERFDRRGIFAARYRVGERVRRVECRFGAGCLVDRFEGRRRPVCGHRRPRTRIAARIRCTTRLDRGLRPGRLDRLGEPGQPVTAHDEHRPRRGCSGRAHRRPELGALGLLDQIPSTCLTPSMSTRSTPTAMWAALLRTCPPSRTLTMIASR